MSEHDWSWGLPLVFSVRLPPSQLRRIDPRQCPRQIPDWRVVARPRLRSSWQHGYWSDGGYGNAGPVTNAILSLNIFTTVGVFEPSPCFSIVLWAMYKVRVRALEGRRVSSIHHSRVRERDQLSHWNEQKRKVSFPLTFHWFGQQAIE